MSNENKLDKIENELCKEIEWYLNDDVPLKEKQNKLQVSLGTNRMINSVIMIETLKQRSRAAENLLAVPLSVEGKLGNFKKEKLSAQMNKVYALNEYCNEIMKGYVNDD